MNFLAKHKISDEHYEFSGQFEQTHIYTNLKSRLFCGVLLKIDFKTKGTHKNLDSNPKLENQDP